MRWKLTRERLQEVLDYDPSTGRFTWLVRPARNVRAGDIAGCLISTGYIRIGIDGEDHLAHRLAFLYVHGRWPSETIDHINGTRSDNRLSNLREASTSENMQNLRTAPLGSKCPLLGVSPNRKGTAFRAQIRVEGKKMYLGTFPTAELAHEAYVRAKRQNHPRGTL